MRKAVLVFVVFIFVTGIWATDWMMPSREARDVKFSTYIAETPTRWQPVVSFEVAPEDMGTSFFDYMIGSYNNLPLRRQPAMSEPYGYQADGMYTVFMYQETSTSQRRIYYSYIDAVGNVSTPSAISPNNVKEGYPGIGIDYVTGNPFVSWHSIIEPDQSYDCSMSYDMYNVVGGPGLWKQPFLVIDNPEVSIPYTGHDNDEFIWPQVWVGPSPEPDMRRVHIYGNNYTSNAGGAAMYNSIYGYCDVQYNESTFDMDLTEWTYQSFPLFDDWHYNDVKRAIKDMCVSEDGQVAFIGHAGDEFFLYHSVDYGENFTLYLVPAHWDVFNPQNQDGSYVFENTDGSPGELFIEPNGDGGHFNVLFTDNNTKILYMTAFGLNTVETAGNDQYYPAHFHPKMVYFDILTGLFEFVDLQITGVDPYDDQPMIPYDLDEDGVVDSWDENGLVEFVTVWPSHFFVGDYQDGSFHEHCFKITKNEEMGWVVAFFMDGRYLMESYYETPGYEDWAEIAQIAVCMSTDHGATWSEPAYLNAKVDDVNFYPELEGMLPCYIYPADEIEIVENNHGRIPIIFFNDNSYGSYSSPVVHGQNNGGTITYAVLDIEIVTDTDDNTVAPVYNLAQNYPNPFNPITTIAYSLKEAANVTLEVFNIKGQKVKTLINEFKQPSDYSVIWDGRDDQGRLQDSGIYFYKLNVGKYSSAKKMLLLK